MSEMDWSLPTELTEKILFNLDGYTLARASTVCKKWNDSYRNLITVFNVWEACCKREIASERLISLIDKLFPAYPISKQGEIDWFLVYKCWFVWGRLKYWDANSCTLIESYDSQVKCLKVSGNWIIYGTVHEGKIMAYNLETKTCIPVFRGLGVIDLDLYNSINFSYASKDFPHDGILFLLSNYSVIRFSLHDMEEVDNIHNYNFSNTRFLLEWLLTIKSNWSFKMDSVGLPYHKSDGWAKRITRKQNVRVNLIGEVMILPKDHNLSNSEIFVDGVEEITHWCQLNYSVLFGIAYKVFHVLFVIVNDKIKAYLPPDQLFNIKSAFLHCNMLFLGNDRGTVFIYKLNSDEDLLKFNFLKYIKKVEISNIAITAIDVQYNVESCNNEIPFLVVSTATSIHRINFK